MRCHDILGIRENAGPEQIEAAYSRRLENINTGADALYPGACERKRRELEQARKDCLAWREKSGMVRVKERITEEIKPRPHEVRTNMFCCGPISGLDSLIGWLLCCHDGTPVAMTESLFGHQGFTIGLDCLLYAIFGFMIAKDREEKRAADEREENKRRIKEAEEEIYGINSSLQQCRRDQNTRRDMIRRDEQQLAVVQAYAGLLGAMGAEDVHEVIDNQQRVLNRSKDRLMSLRQQENDLLREIEEQREIIRDCSNKL